MRTAKVIAAAAFALVLAAACSSYNPYGNNGPVYGSNGSYDIRGTVDSVDTTNHSIWLVNTSGYNTGLASSSGNAVRVYYGNNTTENFNGRTYRPADLERGDEVVVHAEQSGSQIVADSMDVTYNSRGTMTSGSNYPYPSSSSTYPYPSSSSDYSTIRGTVRSVDTYNHTITLDSTSWMSGFRSTNNGSVMTISYDNNSRVDYNGTLYPVTNLERGDVVDVQVVNNGSSNYFAQSLTLVRDVNRSY
jgi:hypothetical protein